MYSVAGECVEEYRQGSNESLTLTRSHLGNLALMEHYTAEELHVVVYHLPLEQVASGSPFVVVDSFVAVDGYEVLVRVGCQLAVEVGSRNYCFLVLGKAACRVFHDGERNGHYLVESHLVFLQSFFLELVNLVEYRLALVEWCLLDSFLELGYFLVFLVGSSLHKLLYLFGFLAQLVVAQSLYLWIYRLYFLYQRLDKVHVASRFVAKQCFQYLVEIHNSIVFCYYSVICCR